MSEVTSGLEASWVEGLSEVSPLRGEWEKLSAESEPEFYFCYDFVELCLRHAAREGKLAVVVAIREEGRLVGVFPFELYRARRFGLRRDDAVGGCVRQLRTLRLNT
ncbi:MAG TPA: hypothetical protein PLP17_04690, partial [Oligoflexia bacterium]|nr:hypothetical protein [Oligoflexia bacterium]